MTSNGGVTYESKFIGYPQSLNARPRFVQFRPFQIFVQPEQLKPRGCTVFVAGSVRAVNALSCVAESKQ
ncbi:MAG: hypothetical protein DLM56_04980 [Pseudonocardiales bacterium]|nr:MAG: hypothetical protein DLM56_04980 [Pseudonocardiales bacterium]